MEVLGNLISILLSMIFGVVGLGVNIILFVVKIFIVMISMGIARYKRRNIYLVGLVIFFWPWLIFVLPFIPKRLPRLSKTYRKNSAFEGLNPVISSIMALSASVAKADGQISKEEISVIKQFVQLQFRISAEDLNAYAGAFEYGKNNPNEYHEFARVIREYYYGKEGIFHLAYVFILIGSQNHELDDDTNKQIKKIILEMGLSEYEYMSIKNSFNHHANSSGGYDGFGAQGAMSEAELLKKHSQALGVSESATMSEIKKAYRKLVKEYHPDELTDDAMTDNYAEFAKQKLNEVNEAYEYLKKAKS